MAEIRLGSILVEQGVLSEEQVERVLQEQQRSGRPFGLICEQMLEIHPRVIETAWSEQYARLTRTIDPEHEIYDPRALKQVTRRQAWQFCVLPIRFEDGELMMATSKGQLLRALRFACNVLSVPAYVVLADPEQLGFALSVHYPLPGMTANMLGRTMRKARPEIVTLGRAG